MSGFEADCLFVDDLVPSPNFGPREPAKPVNLLILHYTGMPVADAALLWLGSPQSQVSCHYFVFEDGRISQLVAEQQRAWHAGVSCWKGANDINSRSIGIEIANPGHDHGYPEFPKIQIEAVARLCLDIMSRTGVMSGNVLAHSDVAPGRKIDPGEKFPWGQLAEGGIGIFAPPIPAQTGTIADCEPADKVQRLLVAFGYCVGQSGEYDRQTRTCIEAFQRHFRPERVDGIVDYSTFDALTKLVQIIAPASA